MAQLNVKLPEDKLASFRRYARRRRTPVSWLIQDYVEYLLAGGRPVEALAAGQPSSDELAWLAQQGGAFDWLAEEPELYSSDDGEPV